MACKLTELEDPALQLLCSEIAVAEIDGLRSKAGRGERLTSECCFSERGSLAILSGASAALACLRC